MTKTITCKTCGKLQDYEKPAGVSGRPPAMCEDHRDRQRGRRSWQAVGAPREQVPG